MDQLELKLKKDAVAQALEEYAQAKYEAERAVESITLDACDTLWTELIEATGLSDYGYDLGVSDLADEIRERVERMVRLLMSHEAHNTDPPSKFDPDITIPSTFLRMGWQEVDRKNAQATTLIHFNSQLQITVLADKREGRIERSASRYYVECAEDPEHKILAEFEDPDKLVEFLTGKKARKYRKI